MDLGRSTLLAGILVMALLQLATPMHYVAAQSRSTEVSEDITNDTYWAKVDGPYDIVDDITIHDGAKLEIENGAEVRFKQSCGLYVEGTLVANDVTFKLLEPSVFRWNGIRFENAEQTGHPLTDIRVDMADYAIDVYGTDLEIVRGSVTNSGWYGINVEAGGTLKLRDSEVLNGEGEGIACYGNVEATGSTVVAYTGFTAGMACSGLVEKSVITTTSNAGIVAEEGSTIAFKDNLINGTLEDTSTGIEIEEGSKITVRGNDIVGHFDGILLDSEAAVIQGNSIRNYQFSGVDSSVNVEISDTFWGIADPTTWSSIPEPANEKVTITRPLSAPFDLPGIAQPPSVWITSHRDEDILKGLVTFMGKAQDPDPLDQIEKVEIRILDSDDREVVPWKQCGGKESWTVTWDTRDHEAGVYYIYLRASSGGDVVTDLGVAVYADTGGGGLGDQDWGLLVYVCTGIVIIGFVIVIVLVYFFVSRQRKKEKAAREQAQAQQATYQVQYYQAQAQAQTLAQQAQQQAQAEAIRKEEAFILEDVFLIYKDGRLIHHDTRRLKPEIDDEMLGGMFTAIQEFIAQSFPTEDGSRGVINEIKYGDAKILLEHGDFVYLATVVKDLKDTDRLHERMAQLIRAIETRTRESLEKWDGQLEALSEAKGMTKLIFTDDPIG
jgi:hypothetical protein